jgi:uncharacterized protein (DUF736 family)
MIIGVFRSERDGYIGHIDTLSFGRRAVVIVPRDENDFSYDVLFVNAQDTTTIKFGAALSRPNAAGSYLKISMDCPALAAPIEATMSLKPSQEKIYTVQWERKKHRSKKT